MTMTDTDPYALSSGLLDDFDGTITEAYFGNDASYNNGDSTLLILELATDNADHPQETVKLSCGSNWVIEAQGAKVVRESGKQQFNKNSRVGMVLAAALAAGAGDVMRGKGSPMDAATWQGLGFHWNRIEVEGFNGDKKEVLLPTGFLGTEKQATVNTATEGVDPATRAKLTILAKKSADYESFVATALEDGTLSSAAVELALDESFFASAKG